MAIPHDKSKAMTEALRDLERMMKARTFPAARPPVRDPFTQSPISQIWFDGDVRGPSREDSFKRCVDKLNRSKIMREYEKILEMTADDSEAWSKFLFESYPPKNRRSSPFDVVDVIRRSEVATIVLFKERDGTISREQVSRIKGAPDDLVTAVQYALLRRIISLKANQLISTPTKAKRALSKLTRLLGIPEGSDEAHGVERLYLHNLISETIVMSERVSEKLVEERLTSLYEEVRLFEGSPFRSMKDMTKAEKEKENATKEKESERRASKRG